jgi:hypothetical protein
MNKTITLKMLIAAKARGDQVKEFKETFGDEVAMSEDLVKEWANRIDFNFAAKKSLPRERYRQYAETCETAGKQCDETTAIALKQRDEAIATAKKRYDETISAALKQYDETTALKFFELYDGDNKP